MKKFLSKISLFFLLVAVLTGLWGWYAFTFEPKNSDSYLAAHSNKMARLDTLSSPRIILVGGSNVAFGFDSGRISDSLQRNVQNMGVHASIGLRYTMDQTARGLRKGDVVIIMPEYEQFFFEYNGSGDIPARTFLYSPPGSWRDLNFFQIINIIDGFPKMEIARREERKSTPGNSGWNYSARNFNTFGDESAHWEADSMTFDFDLTLLPDSPDHYAVADFASKVKDWRNNGYEVFLLWPSTQRENFTRNYPQLRSLEKALEEKGISFDCSPETFLHDASEMFDSDYHVRYPGVRSNTDKMIQFLKSKKI
ncbi:MAG: hypothetical protein K2M31_03170 [Muribaculaceae bacterium]|nr:hypothetical protein [Muribaculaceae bacterium]